MLQRPVLIGDPTIVWEKGRAKITSKRFHFSDDREEEWYFYGNESSPSVIFAVTEDNCVIIGRQWRGGSDCFVYELLGGHPKPGQTQEEAARDELLEEAGCIAESFIALPEFWVDPSLNSVRIIPFLAKGCRLVTKQKLDIGETIEVVKMPLNEWLRLVTSPEENGYTKDGKTLAITLLALPHLGISF